MASSFPQIQITPKSCLGGVSKHKEGTDAVFVPNPVTEMKTSQSIPLYCYYT